MPQHVLWKRIGDFVKYRLLHVDDSPHRIALGVAIGFFVAWTPTLGFQMVLTLMLATLLRANKIVGLPFVWITNPITAAPLYYTNWLVGRVLTRGVLENDPATRETFTALVSSAGSWWNAVTHFFDITFWKPMAIQVMGLGVELWVGSAFVGILLALTSYIAVQRAVTDYRLRHPKWRHQILAVPHVTTQANPSAEPADQTEKETVPPDRYDTHAKRESA